MVERRLRIVRSHLGVALVVALGCAGRGWAQDAGVAEDHICGVDLALPGMMSDILSNALTRGLEVPAHDVNAFLEGAKYENGSEMLRAAAARFNIDGAVLAAEVEKYKHCNCGVGVMPDQIPSLPDKDIEVTAFARDVTLHVVLHEIGHGLIREFDIPILGNEETMAYAFATYYLTTLMPDRAVDVLTARVTSLMIEAREQPGGGWAGEHDHDGRRAYQIAALAVAADAEKYAPVAAVVGMSREDIRDAEDYGAEIRRSWRRVLAPLWMPEGGASSEARVEFDSESEIMGRLCTDAFVAEVEAALKGFDWHSQVTVSLVAGEGGAGWNRSSRTVKVQSAYVRRFVEQGARGLPAAD